jgi:threonine/homoserine/homoserine lactone efflux protein
MNAYLLQGLALGFSGGLAPGPLLALVLSATLRGGFRHGLLVSIAPLLTDLPIVLLTVTVVSQLPHSALRVLSLAGAAVLVQHGVATIRDSRSTRFSELSANAAGSMNSGRTLRQGIVVNFLNPNPWMFWISVGAPLTRSAWMDGPQFVAAFLVPFYLLLVGGKVLLAGAVHAGRSRISDRGYSGLLVFTGLLQFGLAASFVFRALA